MIRGAARRKMRVEGAQADAPAGLQKRLDKPHGALNADFEVGVDRMTLVRGEAGRIEQIKLHASLLGALGFAHHNLAAARRTLPMNQPLVLARLVVAKSKKVLAMAALVAGDIAKMGVNIGEPLARLNRRRKDGDLRVGVELAAFFEEAKRKTRDDVETGELKAAAGGKKVARGKFLALMRLDAHRVSLGHRSICARADGIFG